MENELSAGGEAVPTHREGLQLSLVSRLVPLGAASLYFIFILILGLGNVGLQYDEALLQHGAVHMLNSTSKPAFLHGGGSWAYFAGRHWPVAVIPYVGAVKAYVLLLPFAVFGPSAEVARAVNGVLGAFGIWGIVILLRREISTAVAAAVGFILAIHPAYLDQTLFDNGTVVVWMAILGLIAATVSYYKKQRSALAAFLVGLAMGIGVWNRVNFVWFLASALVSVIIVFNRSALIPVRHIVALIGGGLVGVFPFLLFQITAKWPLLKFMQSGQAQQSLGSLFGGRVRMLSEVMISDAEQRTIWAGPSLPLWQPYFFLLLLLIAVILCLVLRQGSHRTVAWRRAGALTLILFVILMFTSKLNIAEHHLITLVPIAAVVVVLALQGLTHRFRKARILVISVAVIYVVSAVYWNTAAARGLRETGGVNMWSDGIFAVNDYLVSNYEGREVKILDWGLQNNLYVLSNSEIESREIFWSATEERAGTGVRWSDLIARGGVFLTNSGENRHFPTATQGFLAALAASGQPFNRKEFRQKLDRGYAELYEIAPIGAYTSTQARTEATGTLTADPNPVVVCDGSGLGIITIHWTASGTNKIEVRIGSPDGALFASAAQRGSWTTAKWVDDGMLFCLQDVSDGRPLTRENTLATVTVSVTDKGCP